MSLSRAGSLRMALGGAATVAFLAVARPAGVAAQDLSFSTTLDAAGDHLYTGFAEAGVRFGRSVGLQPMVGLGVYLTRVEGDDRVGLAPSVALRRAARWGSVQGKLGWGRSSSTTVGAGAPPTMMMMAHAVVAAPSAARSAAPSIEEPEGGAADESGWNASLQAELAGEGPWTLQGIASYSWGGEVLWTRARVTRALSSDAAGRSIALGGEVVWQGQMDDGDVLRDAAYRATSLGPVVRIARSAGAVWALSAGLKRVRPVAGDTWYAKLEIAIDP